MYSTCIYCTSGLGANEAIEHFPVGRRLAFDADKGRLWAVCPVCARWNLSPLEERWEAMEECERAFRGTSVRTSTENVGLARLRDGTELVRIGRPLRPEFAAWRYGAQLHGRQARAWYGAAAAGGSALGVLGTIAFGPLGLVLGLAVSAAAAYKAHGLPRGTTIVETERAQRRLVDDAGALLLPRDRWLSRARLQPNRSVAQGWSLEMRTELRTVVDPVVGYTGVQQRTHLLTGGAALRALGVMMAGANVGGGTRAQVQNAVRLIDRARSPDAYLASAEEQARRLGAGYRDVWSLPLELRMAVEMASHEEAERRALHGELADLELQWREAEGLAAIADALPLSSGVEEKLDTLKASRDAWARKMAARRDGPR